ncbi:N-acetylmuramoyl-L-alanine amidase [Loigolactobacillus zhaoyuanensis]|uniref:N-acetylmuramoyl-L-alanine amidase n=1 Tax=Loigolactobacillus zhaoyuanensis TaxID=2486017 RepID=UPI001CDCE90F|nr:N-acetylmuramoyl-L-alanine amidase [Loigolactobacillus zhaoyuanensis]
MHHIAKKIIGLTLLLGLLFSASSLAMPRTAYAQQETITVTASTVNVRMGPGLAYNTMAQLKKGDKITVIAHKNSWYQVRLGSDKIGWVASWLLKNTEISSATNTQGTINTANVAAKENPADDSDTLGTFQQNTAVTIIYENSGWSQVLFNQTVAWIKSAYITKKDASTTQQNTQLTVDSTIKSLTLHEDNVKLRTTPNIGGHIKATLKNKAQLTYLATSDDWYKVQTKDGKTGYVANWTVTPSASNKPVTTNANNLAEATIVLDPGHGGNDSGAVSQKNTYEKTYTMQFVKKIAAKLRQAGARVVLTRKTDKFVDLAPRPALAKKVHADAFISIHFDSSPKSNQASGTTTYYYGKSKDKPLATALNKQFSSLPLANRGVEFGNFLVLRDNKQPAVLLELGYINDSNDYQQIRSTSYQDKVANDIYKGLSQYFK